MRQEIPTLENGLVALKTPTPTSYRMKVAATTTTTTPPSSSSGNTGLPDLSHMSLGRRGSQQPQQSQQIPTRSRSRTLPSSDHFRPEFVKSASSNNFLDENHHLDEESDDSDSLDKCEIRRGSGPLLDPYGVPIQNRTRYNSKPVMPPPFSTPTAVPSPVQQQLMVQSDLNQKIRVCVRKRPLNKKELERAEKDIAPTCGVRSINVNEPK